MNIGFRDSITCSKVVKWSLMLFLVFIPFQLGIFGFIEPWNKKIAKLVTYIDEITIAVFFPLALIKFYKNREMLNVFHLIFIFPILMLVLFGFVSAIKNGNSLFITILGIFDYIKYLLMIFIYSAFFRDFDYFKKIFKLLLIVAVLLGTVAIIQEVWALAGRYILGKSINDLEIYVFRSIWSPDIVDSLWRFGIYRAPSLAYHPNILGLYCVLIFSIYICNEKKVNYLVVTSLLSGVLLSISRMIYAAFIFIIGFQIFKKRKRFLILFLAPILIIVFFMVRLPDFDLSSKSLSLQGLQDDQYSYEKLGGIPFRKYYKDKAIEIWKDRPVWGVGPGMFGGVIATLYNSYVYDEYNIHKNWLALRVRTLDQFWPRVLAEMGIMGTALFAGLFLSLFVAFFVLKNNAKSQSVRYMFTGLLSYTIVILIYTSGSDLNVAPVLITYSAFTGIGINLSGKKYMGNSVDSIELKEENICELNDRN